MSSDSAGFTGDISTQYDSGLGPNIFTDYGDLLTEQCCALHPASVLELAAGTGIVSRKLRDALPEQTRLVISDLNPPMLEVAKAKFAASEAVDFMEVNAMEVPFANDSFDVIACQFGVMFFPDKPASYVEVARALKPGGHYVFNVWGSLQDNPFSHMADAVGKNFFPDNPPGFYKVPFHYHDVETVRAELAAADWDTVEHKTTHLSKRIVDPDRFARALVYGNPIIDEIRDRGTVDPEDMVKAMRAGLDVRFAEQDMVMPLSATQYLCRKP
ncbi:MAG: class I SAM-dependent methyltransferase [Paracoccaceae bacterium]